jgi:hypothetical protein
MAENGDAGEEQRPIEDEEIQRLEAEVPAAAAWFIFNAQGIYDHEFGPYERWEKNKTE